jgi:hypothetical protein
MLGSTFTRKGNLKAGFGVFSVKATAAMAPSIFETNPVKLL